ncbi:MAG: hypothetical protein PHE89_05320 [Alphaproteobacteria bacterium]|nr:hypothetical protein [Alphaproteobacteria bacterium]
MKSNPEIKCRYILVYGKVKKFFNSREEARESILKNVLAIEYQIFSQRYIQVGKEAFCKTEKLIEKGVKGNIIPIEEMASIEAMIPFLGKSNFVVQVKYGKSTEYRQLADYTHCAEDKTIMQVKTILKKLSA